MKFSYKILKALKNFYNLKDFREYLRYSFYIPKQDVFFSSDGIKFILIANKDFDFNNLKFDSIAINYKYIDECIKNKNDLILNQDFVEKQKNDGLYQNVNVPNYLNFLKPFFDKNNLTTNYTIATKQMNYFLRLINLFSQKNEIQTFTFLGSNDSNPAFEATCGDYKIFCIISKVVI